jgi:hypothetical protein
LLRPKLLATPLVALALAVLGSTAGARPAGVPPSEAEISQARERFAAARKLEDAGRWAEALTVLQRVAEVKMTPQVRFHIALCLENVGLWTQALEAYDQAIAEAGTSAPEVVKEANEHKSALEQTIPTVSLRVEGAAEGDELLLDRRRLPIDERQQPVRTDPGAHTAEVRRGGAVLAREYFAVTPRSSRRVDLRIGTIAPEPPAPSAPSAPPGTVEPVPGGSPPAGRTQRALGWTAIGVGATSVVVTGVFAGLRAAALDRLKASCPTLTQCPPSVSVTVSEGKIDAALVNVFGVLAGVATAAGVALLVTAPSSPRRSAPAPVAWIELRGDGSLVLRGVF